MATPVRSIVVPYAGGSIVDAIAPYDPVNFGWYHLVMESRFDPSLGGLIVDYYDAHERELYINSLPTLPLLGREDVIPPTA